MEVFCTMFRHCSTESVTDGTLISGPNPHAFGVSRKKAVLVFLSRVFVRGLVKFAPGS